ncbi:hypothetical protein [Leptospira kanakyensis]|nr:hypothetical protein [Leptospira kanakyensis]
MKLEFILEMNTEDQVLSYTLLVFFLAYFLTLSSFPYLPHYL